MTTPNNPNHPGRRGYWQEMWKHRREVMANNLAKINEARQAKADEKTRLIEALIAQLPPAPLTSTALRNALRDAWNLSYGDNITSPQAWNLVRAGRRKGIFVLAEDGTYTFHHR